MLLGVLPFALLLVGIVGYGLARRGLAPIDRLRKATDEITAERLHQRIDVVNPDDELGRLGQTINAMIARLERSFTEIRRFTAAGTTRSKRICGSTKSSREREHNSPART